MVSYCVVGTEQKAPRASRGFLFAGILHFYLFGVQLLAMPCTNPMLRKAMRCYSTRSSRSS